MLIYETIADVAEAYVEPGGAQVLWIDSPEDEASNEDDQEPTSLSAFTLSALKEKNGGHILRGRK